MNILTVFCPRLPWEQYLQQRKTKKESWLRRKCLEQLSFWKRLDQATLNYMEEHQVVTFLVACPLLSWAVLRVHWSPRPLACWEARMSRPPHWAGHCLAEASPPPPETREPRWSLSSPHPSCSRVRIPPSWLILHDVFGLSITLCSDYWHLQIN